MIVAVGTKGMMIKTAGVLLELDRRKIGYHFVNLGQHGKRMFDLANLFGLRSFDISLSREGDLDSISGVLKWFVKSLWRNKEIFREDELAVIQGDAPATLLGLLMAKLWGLEVAHVEAGLRSNSLLDPFPEEFVRRVVDGRSSILFAPSDEAYSNLEKERVSGRVFNTKFNTVYDAIKIALKNDPKTPMPTSEYVLASIHRVENIYSHGRMKTIVEVLREVNKRVVWPLHPPTKNSLVRYRLMPRLKGAEFRPLQDYFSFIHLMKNASFLITDGGGPQEESYVLGTPCLLMRMRTERPEGLGENVLLSRFEKERIHHFFNSYERFRTEGLSQGDSPSKTIVDVLERLI